MEIPKIKLTLSDEHKTKNMQIREQMILNAEKLQLTSHLVVPERFKQALVYVKKMVHEKENLSVEHICLIHKSLGLSGKPREPSKVWFDENNIGVNGFHPPGGEYIEMLLTQYVNQYNRIDSSADPLETCCRTYFHFVLIHPFNDGNGRTGRALCARMMLSSGYGVLAHYLEAK